jgi:hypothetical protein
MPVFRYFLVMGCCLLGLIFAAGWMWPNTAAPESAPVATASAGSASVSLASENLGSLADWRRLENRLVRKKHAEAIMYPDVATHLPTADRLQWERQLRYLPENHIYEARAEMPKTADKPAEPKVAEKKAPVRKHIARAQTHARVAANNYDRANFNRAQARYYARNNAWDPFGLFD